MARKRKSSGLEDAMDLVAMLPWWGGVGLALVSYVFLHRMAQPPPVVGLQAGQMGGFLAGSLVSALANVGQLLVPSGVSFRRPGLVFGPAPAANPGYKCFAKRVSRCA